MNTDAVTAILMVAFAVTIAYLTYLRASRMADRRRQARLRLSAEAVSRLQAAIDRSEVVVLKGDGATLRVVGGIDGAWLLDARSGTMWTPEVWVNSPF
jgi:hypothetical protein